MRTGTKVKTAVRVRPVMFNQEKQNSTKPSFESNMQVLTNKDEIRLVDITDGQNTNKKFNFDRTFSVGSN